MPWIPAENPRHLPAAPDALAPAVPAPVIPMAPPGHPDNGRAWSREGAAMTPELQRDTQPYLQAIMKMGGDFKVAHASGLSESIQAKALKGYLADNPLPKDATSKQRRALELGAKEILDNLEQNLPIFREVRDQTRDLRNEFKTASATAATCLG